MVRLFIAVLNMSFTGAFVIAVICAARLPLKRAPKIASYCLWAVAGFRLVFPFSFESVISLIPFNARPIPADIATQAVPRIESGVSEAIGSMLSPVVPAANVNPMQIWTAIGAYVWLIGAALMIAYGIVSYVLLKRKMRNAANLTANIYEAENIKSPFLLGIVIPRIYLPTGLSAKEREHVVLHERTHIKRRDYLVKLFAFFVLCLHWFNPLVWAAFLLMGADMEMSCDERVLRETGTEVKKDYSLSLLSLAAAERRVVAVSPLAFGEGGIKGRINNVLNFKKPSRWIVVASVTLVAVLSVGFAVNRRASRNEQPEAAIPQKTPLLDVNLVTTVKSEDSQTQTDRSVRAAQLTNSWYVTDENGEGFGYSADSVHPLQRQEGYEDVALTLNGTGTATLFFSDNYPPYSISAQRWDAKYAGLDSYEMFNEGEPVIISGNTFKATDDGNDYIYEIHAKWNEGDSFYVFSLSSYSSQDKSNALTEESQGKSKPAEFVIVNTPEPVNTLIGTPEEEAAQTVVYENVEMRRYTDSNPGHSIQPHPYIHDVWSNNSDKTITGRQRGMLAFDKNGKPLEIDWFSIDSELESAYFFLYDWDTEVIEPHEISDAYGGWSLNFYGEDPVVEEIAYVLYCDKQISFADGTVWDNPDFESWKSTYEGKTTEVEVLENYYPFVQDIN
jgi:beta-lactamase regulating signal transducer with metallopeptidase domain